VPQAGAETVRRPGSKEPALAARDYQEKGIRENRREIAGRTTTKMNFTLQDLYRFLVRIHQDEHAASIDFERFMAGETPDHVIAYCRRAVSAEREYRSR
jgi:hypothetical protein